MRALTRLIHFVLSLSIAASAAAPLSLAGIPQKQSRHPLCVSAPKEHPSIPTSTPLTDSERDDREDDLLRNENILGLTRSVAILPPADRIRSRLETSTEPCASSPQAVFGRYFSLPPPSLALC